MTRYEQGFMSKCAEYGLDAGTAMGLLEKRAQLIGGLTGYFSQRDDKNAPNARTGGRRGAKKGAIVDGLASALLVLLATGHPMGAISGGLGGAAAGGLTGYFGGRLAGHRNEKDLRNGVDLS